MRKSWSKLHKSLSQLVTEDSKSSNRPSQQMDNIKDAILQVFRKNELPQINLYDFHLQVNIISEINQIELLKYFFHEL